MSKLRQAELNSSGDRDLMLLGVKANGAVKGRLLVMTLEQRYRNSSSKNTEITYTFPLPYAAVLLEIEVQLNGKVLKGEVSPRSTARAKYEEAISEGNSGIMLEKNHDGSFTLELGNLIPREECSIMIRYSQVLATEHGQVRLMLPTTIAPRFGNPIKQGKLHPHQVPVTDLTAEYPFDITLTLYGDLAYAKVGSPSHKTSYSRIKEDLVVKLSQRGFLDRDFILVIDAIENVSDGLACKDLYEDGQYALIAFFNPRIESLAPKSLTAKVLVDCSSSMSGDSIEAARRALSGIVTGLGKDDRFSLSRFGTTVEHRSRGMWSGTPQAKASAKRWIDNVLANLGGTEMSDALVSTIAIAHTGKCDILLITDGEIYGIDEVIEVAKKSKHRVFTVAIGASPAETHLRRLASATGGHCDFVAPGEDVEPAVLRMSARMRAVRATDMRVEWPQSMSVRWGQKVQDYAFEDDAFNVCAFVQTPGDEVQIGRVKLWGRIEGQDGEVLMAEAPLSVTQSSTNILARLTAYARYQEQVRERVAMGAPSSVSVSQDLAVAYKLVTDETNFILVHERSAEEKSAEMPDAHKVPQMLAAGWGGTGSVVRAESRPRLQIVLAHEHAETDYSIDGLNCDYSPARGRRDNSGTSTPAVWRTNKTNAAAKVDALSGGGMDDYEIPAFLRKDADGGPGLGELVRMGIDKLNSLFWKELPVPTGIRSRSTNDPGYVGLTPAGIEKWLSVNDHTFWPKTYAELRDIGLDLPICEWLEFGIGSEREEGLVVATFLMVVQEFSFFTASGLSRTVKAIKHAVSPPNVSKVNESIAVALRNGLKGIAGQSWPVAVVNFPQSVSA
jgi:Ca-activated chloride channel family protein